MSTPMASSILHRATGFFIMVQQVLAALQAHGPLTFQAEVASGLRTHMAKAEASMLTPMWPQFGQLVMEHCLMSMTRMF